MRTFDTGATRDDSVGKPDFESVLSPFVLERYAIYMLKHTTQADGTVRESDNWQKGIPINEYIKSGLRHVMVWWKLHRKHHSAKAGTVLIEDVLCAVMFNVMGYLHELLRAKSR
jgi:hypothetical protein